MSSADINKNYNQQSSGRIFLRKMILDSLVGVRIGNQAALPGTYTNKKNIKETSMIYHPIWFAAKGDAKSIDIKAIQYCKDKYNLDAVSNIISIKLRI